ncbi:hypothetical protein EV361DRAFT_504432 [Lentinula raphanica]|nr:hypothetical protein EV361DRAFT_504432 [Lentinula raphanica]
MSSKHSYCVLYNLGHLLLVDASCCGFIPALESEAMCSGAGKQYLVSIMARVALGITLKHQWHWIIASVCVCHYIHEPVHRTFSDRLVVAFQRPTQRRDMLVKLLLIP